MGLSALAQTQAAPASQTDSQTPTVSTSTTATMDPNNSATYATGKPLATQSNEGFWGHMNPFARKKWVNRQVQPIKDQVNELDQLQAKNANDIRDVDSRAQAGINKAQNSANAADQHAQAAASTANAAQQTASTASDRTNALNTTVGNLDQYQQVSQAAVPFAAGRTTLGPSAKADLDALATSLANEKGYIIEVQGYSRGGVQTSQAMADAVVRYLVTEHQVPMYRIYRSGLGRNTAKATDGEKLVTNGVRVTLLHNSLATMSRNGAAPQTSTSSGTVTQ
jgi:outer membrane protein OmpA-like peptidoglycan-associated protein